MMLARPKAIQFSPEAIPPDLIDLPRWVLWRYTLVGGKWTKVPYQPDGRKASTSNQGTWGPFADAVAASRSYDGLGFVFNGDGLVGVDMDKVIDDSGMWSDTAQDILDTVPGYAEISPSGTGLHIITRADSLDSGKSKNGIEVYSTGRYFTFTGSALASHKSLPAERVDLYPFMNKYFGEEVKKQLVNDRDPFGDAPVGKAPEEVRALLGVLKNEDLHYEEWFKVIAAVHHELGDEGRELAHEWSSSSAKHTDGRFDICWNSLGRYTGRQVTLRSLLKGNTAKSAEKNRSISGFVQAAAFMSSQKVEWHIKHVIPKRGLVVVYGAPGSSKSFFVLDMVAHIARGVGWRGHRVRQSSVAYVAAEGVSGFGNRLRAYAKHHDLDISKVPLFVRGGSLILNEEVLELIEQLQLLPEPGVVVIDTLASVSPGANENTSEGMGPIVQAAQLIIEATGSTVILIHHTNKIGEMRGWSGLLGALDNQIRIERKDDLRTAHIQKLKEEKDGNAYGYTLKIVSLGEDEDGDTITSCVVEPCEEVASISETPKKNPRGGDFETSSNFSKARRYLEVIKELVGLGEANVDEKDVVEAIQRDKVVNPLEEPDYPRKDNIKSTLLRLGEYGKITKEGRWIRVCG